MNLLLDTHTLIWYLQGNDNLSYENRQIIEDQNTVLYFSIASVWEMSLKINNGKLVISKPLHYFIPENIKLLDIKLNYIYKLEAIPFFHKDPFDRIIIASALVENLTIMTKDNEFSKYDINTIWK